ncbi:MAG TPA: hypothetical protein PLY09_07390 [Methanothrix sp.]|nr:hypothetical protein [Methanothrix sp.]
MTLKLDAFAVDENSLICNDFNRTENMKICYKLSNTMRDNNAIADIVIINADISNIFDGPEKDLMVYQSDKGKIEQINDGRGFHLECRVDPELKECDDRKVSVKVDPSGHLRAEIGYLRPNEMDIVSINYSANISKNAPRGERYCSNINNVIFTKYICKEPLEPNISNISIKNNMPRANWGITPNETYILRKNIFEGNMIYILSSGAEIGFECEPFDVETDKDKLNITLYDISENNEIKVLNGTFKLNTPGIHKFEVEVNDGEEKHTEMWTNSIRIENITLDDYILNTAVKTHRYKNVFGLILVSMIAAGVFIYLPHKVPTDHERTRRSFIRKNHISILSATLLVSFISLVSLYITLDNIYFNVIYLYECLVYLMAMCVSIISIKYKLHSEGVSESTVTYTDNTVSTSNDINKVIFKSTDWNYAGITSIIFLIIFHQLLPEILKMGLAIWYIATALIILIMCALLQQFPIEKMKEPRKIYIISLLIAISVIIIFCITTLYAEIGLKINYKFEDLFAIFLIEFVLVFILLCSPVMPHLIYDLIDIVTKYAPKM